MFRENFDGFLNEVTKRIPDESIFRDAPLSNFSTYRVGGSAALLLRIEDPSVFSIILKGLKKFPLPILLIGNGSNLLISDDGEERVITCETTEQFMDVKEVVHKLLDPERIEYAGLSIHEKTK